MSSGSSSTAKERPTSPWAVGNLCVKPGGIGLLRISDPLLADNQGAVSLEVDFTQPPFDSGPGQIIPLTSWNLQYWYRDPTGPGNFNFSNALEAIFCP